MAIQEDIEIRLLQSMRDGDSAATSTLRMLKAALKNASIAAQGELSTEQQITVLQKEVKMRQDAAQSYEKGERPELAEKERTEMALIKEFLPEAPSAEMVTKAVKEAITTTGATSMAQMGVVIGSARSSLGVGAEASMIAAEAKRQLTDG